MLALSIRQPYAELILHGEKTIEYRSRPTRIIGERFYIYAAKGTAISHPLSAVSGQIASSPDRQSATSPHFPTGLIVGTAVIRSCQPAAISHQPGARGRESQAGTPVPLIYEWHLTEVRRMKRPRKPSGQPQPVWFRPFGAKGQGRGKPRGQSGR